MISIPGKAQILLMKFQNILHTEIPVWEILNVYFDSTLNKSCVNLKKSWIVLHMIGSEPA